MDRAGRAERRRRFGSHGSGDVVFAPTTFALYQYVGTGGPTKREEKAESLLRSASALHRVMMPHSFLDFPLRCGSFGGQ
jgi:hypothetical protein